MVVLESVDAYHQALAEHGPCLRAMWVQPAGWRGPRKPSLFDEQRPIDALDLADAARAFLRRRPTRQG